MGKVKTVLNDIFDAIEDVAATIVGVILIVFIAGQLYAVRFFNTDYFYYPIYLFIALLVLKLFKDPF